MNDTNARLATLIGSRICHDLISPIGAISNGLELMGLAGQMKGPEFDLIADSVQNAGARIRFFRIAYGAAGDQMLGRPEIMSVLSDMNHGNRVKLAWRPADPQSRADVRLAFLAMQCCEVALPYGGTVEAFETDGSWTIIGTGEKMAHNPDLWRLLDTGLDAAAEITPATVQFALLPLAVADAGRPLHHEAGQHRITVSF